MADSPPQRDDLSPHPYAIQRNSVYVTFNAPEVDDYHRGILITTPSTRDGTLYHAVYDDDKWRLEIREINHLSSARSLVLIYRIGGITNHENNEEAWLLKCEQALSHINMNPDTRSDDLAESLGNPKLGGYSCVVWSVDAVRSLQDYGCIEADPEGRSPEALLDDARELAGPKDGREMVGESHGGLRVVN